MSKVLIIYYSKTGNTEKMAQMVSEGVNRVPGVSCSVQRVEDTSLEDLLEADGIIIGSPTYYGVADARTKDLIDRSVKYHGQLEGKVGGAFTSSANVGGGNETTLMNLIAMLLVHGMIVPGFSKGDHYGPVSIGAPDQRVEENCHRVGQRIAELVNKLS